MTDRLRDALARAAELISYPHLPTKYANWLAGWAQAVKLMPNVPCDCEEFSGQARTMGHRSDCAKSLADTAVRKFCDAMLGEEKS